MKHSPVPSVLAFGLMVAHAVAAAITKAIANKVLIFFILRFLMSQPAKLRLSESHDACINGRA